MADAQGGRGGTDRWRFVLLVAAVAATATGCPRGVPLPIPGAGQRVAIFAGGCFWCMEPPFEGLPGVRAAISGYSGGWTLYPSYEEVSAGKTGHAEAVWVLYDARRASYAQLLRVFWHNIDPFSGDGQFCDRGRQYRPAIFYLDDRQRALAVASKRALERRFRRTLPVTIQHARTFWSAEAIHQDYHRTHPRLYRDYRRKCGRDRRLRAIWGAETGR